MYLRPWRKELAWSCYLIGKILATSICADGEENLSGSDRSPTFEEWKQRFKEERSNGQFSMDIIKDSNSNTNITPDDLTNKIRLLERNLRWSLSLSITNNSMKMQELRELIVKWKIFWKSWWWLKKKSCLEAPSANAKQRIIMQIELYTCNDRLHTL